jgi:hypothetical protein
MQFSIIQANADRPAFRDIAFRDLAAGAAVNFDDYETTYTGTIEAPTHDAALALLWRRFNIDHPADFKGRSLSVSDVVLLGGDALFYCQSVGWLKLRPDQYEGQF